MPKQIVAKTEIPGDSNLTIIKAFRIANKRAGEAKLLGPDGMENYMKYSNIMLSLKQQADEAGFKLFVMNGKTGHTYGKDYKETPDAQNDFEAYVASQNRPTPEPVTEPEAEPECDPDPDNLESDEDTN